MVTERGIFASSGLGNLFEVVLFAAANGHSASLYEILQTKVINSLRCQNDIGSSLQNHLDLFLYQITLSVSSTNNILTKTFAPICVSKQRVGQPFKNTLKFGGISDVDRYPHAQLLFGEIKINQCNLGVLNSLRHGCKTKSNKLVKRIETANF